MLQRFVYLFCRCKVVVNFHRIFNKDLTELGFSIVYISFLLREIQLWLWKYLLKCNFLYKSLITQVFSRHVENIISFFIRLVSSGSNNFSFFSYILNIFPGIYKNERRRKKEPILLYEVLLLLVDDSYTISFPPTFFSPPFPWHIWHFYFHT